MSVPDAGFRFWIHQHQRAQSDAHEDHVADLHFGPEGPAKTVAGLIETVTLVRNRLNTEEGMDSAFLIQEMNVKSFGRNITVALHCKFSPVGHICCALVVC